MSSLSVLELQSLEKEMIRVIIERYFQCKQFFELNNNYKDINQINEKNFLIKQISHDFFEKFKFHPSIISDDYGLEVLENYHRVFIRVKDGSFPFPHAFTRFMNRLQDINLIPIQEIDLTIVDEYMEEFSDSDNLEDFLLGFFLVIKSLKIPLRERDLEMLQILTDVNFLLKDQDAKIRIHPPDLKEIVLALGYSDKQFLRIKRAYYFLYNFRICYTNVFIMNPTKFGFITTFFEYSDEHKDHMQKLRPFILWDFPFKDRKIAVATVPFGNVNELLDPFDFVQLTKWSWNTNFDHFSFEKNDPLDGWKDFHVPNFLSRNFVYTDDYVSWDLTQPYKDDFSEHELEILRNLTKSNTITYSSLSRLSETISPGGIRHILAQFVENGVYQLYPNVMHVGLKEIIVTKIICQNKEYFNSIINNLLTLPISHVFTNEQENLIISYFHIPGKFVENLTDILQLLSYKLKDKIKIEYELLPKSKTIYTLPPIRDIDFTVKNGIAYIIDK